MIYIAPMWAVSQRESGGVSVYPIHQDANGDFRECLVDDDMELCHTIDCDNEDECLCEPDVFWLDSEGEPLENGPVYVHQYRGNRGK